MVRTPDRPRESPSQTAGPYVHVGCTPNAAGIAAPFDTDLGGAAYVGDVAGERITIVGTVRDGAGAAVRDALIEIWQADARGLHASPEERRGRTEAGFAGWARATTDPSSGEFAFATIKPGRVPYVDDRLQAPHVSVWIAARGINTALHTRAYFDDEPDANAEDPLLARVDPPSRVATLLAVRESAGRYRFDIHLQGDAETVFLDM